MTTLSGWMLEKYFYLSAFQWVALGSMLLITPVIIKLVTMIISVLSYFAKKTTHTLDDRFLKAIQKPLSYVSVVGLWFIFSISLDFPAVFEKSIFVVLKILFGICIIWIFLIMADFLSDIIQFATKKTDTHIADYVLNAVQKILRAVIIVLGILIILQNLGINVMSLLAGLGLGGLALALAAKDTAANLFGSFMILIDKPFALGDWVIVDEIEGSVEDVGLRSTRIRTFYNSLVSIPNATLANSNIDNMGKRQYRRIRTVLGIEYQTDSKKLKDFMNGIKDIIEKNPLTRKESYEVSFHEYGPSSLNVLLYFFIDAKNWSEELKQKESIYLEILEFSKSIGVSFAFPSQSIYIKNKESLQTV